MTDVLPTHPMNERAMLLHSVERESLIAIVNRRCEDEARIADRCAKIQLFDTVDADGRELKRTKRLRGDHMDIQTILERCRRYQKLEEEIRDAELLMQSPDIKDFDKPKLMKVLQKLRDLQGRELEAIELTRVNMRRDGYMQMTAAIKMLSDAALMQQREDHHQDQMDIMKGRQAGMISDRELEAMDGPAKP